MQRVRQGFLAQLSRFGVPRSAMPVLQTFRQFVIHMAQRAFSRIVGRLDSLDARMSRAPSPSSPH